ncbi:YaeQ family protein [Caballeronia novacaledonica]|uniref:YaeQ family protein n=1 Tax=Caballeronia novacaledonica TaxID=1544861 RepID=UPI001EE3656E|nr:YaeQ family protein [Caballeronia novacaledonica]GJH07700.1 YaeQ family protein [Caballeronia novacaledonica]
MALKSTIYKADLQVADMDRHYYGDHSLTIARHPSETDDRMMVRVAAFGLFADERLEFCKGLSDTDEPDLWQKDLTGQIQTWIEVGQPDERRISKASGRSDRVIVIAYAGRTADIWWNGVKGKVERLQNVTVWSLAEGCAEALGKLAARTMRLQLMVQDADVSLSSETVDAVAIRWNVLKAGAA